MQVPFTVNGRAVTIDAPPNTFLVHAIREHLHLTGTHVGCDTAQCGACTVHVDGRAIKSCNVLVAQVAGKAITTIEGIAEPDGTMHPMQAAFKECHGLQCGYCTPGQLCSARGMLDEARAGHPSHATQDVNAAIVLTADEIRERMSGNLCRCGAYVNIVAAIREVAGDEASAAAQAVHS